MTNLRFISIKLENFRKHKLYELDLADRGFIRIEGPNGAGKSSIFEAITWCLFGDEGRGSSASSVIKAGTKTAKVTLKMCINSNTVVVQRERSVTSMSVSIMVNGEPVEINTAKAGQDYINAILGISSDVFGHVVFIKQYMHRYFFELTDSEQKALIETLFGLDFLDGTLAKFKQMKKSVLLKKQELEKLQNTRDAYIRSMSATLAEEQKQLEKQDLSSRLKEIDAELLKAKEALKGVLEKTKEEQSKQPGIQEKIVSLTVEHETLTKEYQTTVKKEKELKEQIKELMAGMSETYRQTIIKQTLEKGNCVICGAKVTKERQKTMEAEISNEDLTTQLNVLNDEEEKLSNKTDKLYKQIEEIKARLFEAQREEQQLQENLRELQHGKRFVEQTIDTLETEKNQLQTTKAGNEAKIKHLKQKIKDMEDVIPYSISVKFDIILSAIDEGIKLFGPLGVRNDVFEKYLNSLSSLINETLSVILPGTVVNISTESTTSTGESRRKFKVDIERKDKFSYYDLSGGERKRMNIAFTLALHSFIEQLGDIRTNILILDEIFDALDAQGMEIVSELLNLYEKESIFLITHSPYKTESDNIIMIGDE